MVQLVIIYSKENDLINSLKSAISYTISEDIKFSFFTEEESLYNYIAKYGKPHLILHDRGIESRLLQSDCEMTKGILSESPSTSNEEVFIYQSVVNFIKDVKRMLGSTEVCKTVIEGKRIWVLDPFQSDWSKQLFLELANHFYTKSARSICVDVSFFGSEQIAFSNAYLGSISDELATFHGISPSAHVEQKKPFKFMKAVAHPMDLLAINAQFWEQRYLKMVEDFSNHVCYSGLMSDNLVRTMADSFDYLFIATSEMSATEEQLIQMKSWFLQVNPKLDIEIYQKKHFNLNQESILKSIKQYAGLE